MAPVELDPISGVHGGNGCSRGAGLQGPCRQWDEQLSLCPAEAATMCSRNQFREDFGCFSWMDAFKPDSDSPEASVNKPNSLE